MSYVVRRQIVKQEPRHENICFCICENKGTDQLCDITAQVISAFVSSTYIVHSPNIKQFAIFCDYTARFVSDLVRNPEDRISCDGAHILSLITGARVKGSLEDIALPDHRTRSAFPNIGNVCATGVRLVNL